MELAAEHHRVVLRDSEMADRELMQLGRELLLLEEIAGLDIHIDERGLHGGDVQLLPLAVGMGEDAAIGDDHGAAVGEECQVMGPDAVARELADLAVAVARRPARR